MPVVSPERLAALQHDAENVRNICILAHVDHGKTSLSDALIATNGIISPKMAGKIRYLDSRPDEQLRGITMESSAISLCFTMARRSSVNASPEQKDYLINLIDSPGHVDFSSEVSTASRLCDGAVVLVDAVEGVCSQTVTVLRQVWIEHMKPILVVNKVDRLIWELKMSAGEAYTHLSRLVEEVNAVLGSFFQGERMEEDLQWREKMEQRVAAAASKEAADIGRAQAEGTDSPSTEDSIDNSEANIVHGYEEKDDESIYFAPENNNIIFSSAVDGWAFTVRQFASLYEKKLGIKRSVLEKYLWGDYYLDPKTKRVLTSKHLKGRNLKPMFVQLVLDNLWTVYEATTGGSKGKGDSKLLEKVTKSLAITIPAHVARSRDPKALMTTVFSSWLPLSTAVLVSVIEHLPSPPSAQAERLPALIEASPGSDHVDPNVREAMIGFKTAGSSPAIAYVSKMVSIPVSELPENKRKAGSSLSPEEARELAKKKRAELAKGRVASDDTSGGVDRLAEALRDTNLHNDDREAEENGTPEEPEQLIGFARLYCGTLSIGDSVYILPPKYSPAMPYAHPEPRKVTITALYLFMGRSLEALASVPAGVIFGIGGLEGHLLKSGTICTQLEGGVNLAGLNMGVQPIVRVALEPVDPRDLGKMINGMKLLEQSDPCAQYEVLESGEHVISTAGELHLERCLKDLRERFARCDIQAGEPIVPFRETIIAAAEMPPSKVKDLPRGTVISVSPSTQLSLRLRVRPLPSALLGLLEKHAGAIRRFYDEQRSSEEISEIHGVQADAPVDVEIDRLETSYAQDISLEEFRRDLKAAAVDKTDQADGWPQAIERITAFGPRRTGPNLLVDATSQGICKKFLQEDDELYATHSVRGSESMLSDLAGRVAYAFQLATAQGPLCNEPIQGIAVFLEEISLPPQQGQEDESAARADAGRVIGEVIRMTREAIRQGFKDWSPRMMLALYSCEIQAATEVLGKVYGVITRRRGRILSEALNEGTPFFTITAVLPVAESFGFSDEIRKRTSGGASPQLRFQGFEMLDEDPFWVPFTEDELEDLGELADKENVAKRYMDVVRQRKGLLTRATRTTEGEKARTLKK